MTLRRTDPGAQMTTLPLLRDVQPEPCRANSNHLASESLTWCEALAAAPIWRILQMGNCYESASMPKKSNLASHAGIESDSDLYKWLLKKILNFSQ